MQSIYGDRWQEVVAEREVSDSAQAWERRLEIERISFERRKNYIMAYMKTNKVSGEPVIYNITAFDLSHPNALPTPVVSTSLDRNSFHASALAALTGSKAPSFVYDGKAADELTKLIESGQKNIVVTSSDDGLSIRSLEEAIDRVGALDETLVIYLQSEDWRYRQYIVAGAREQKGETQEEQKARRGYESALSMGLARTPLGAKAGAKNIVLKIIPSTGIIPST
jgi:hypothetical protein